MNSNKENIEKIFRDFILNTPKNKQPDFKIGDIVNLYIYKMEYSLNHLNVNTEKDVIEYEVIKKHSDDKYDIKKISDPTKIEKDVDGKHLFPTT